MKVIVDAFDGDIRERLARGGYKDYIIDFALAGIQHDKKQVTTTTMCRLFSFQ